MPRAVGYMLLSAASFSLMGAAVKAAGDLPVHEKVFFRNLVTLLVTVVMALRQRENPFGPTSHLLLLVLRSVAGLGGVVLYFYTLRHLTLADAALLTTLAPFFVSVFAAIWLAEPFTRRTLGGVALALAGAALVIRPGFDWQPLPAVAGIGAATCAGAAYTVVRKLKGRESPRRIVFYFSLLSTVAMVPPLVWHHVNPTAWQWVWLVGTGISAAGGQVFLTLAYHHAPASKISIWSYNNVIFSLIIGLVAFGEQPGLWTILGGALIVTAALLNRRAR